MKASTDVKIFAVFAPNKDQMWMFSRASSDATSCSPMSGRFVIAGQSPDTASLYYTFSETGPVDPSKIKNMDILQGNYDAVLAVTESGGWTVTMNIDLRDTSTRGQWVTRHRQFTLVPVTTDTEVDPTFEITDCTEIVPNIVASFNIEPALHSYLTMLFMDPSNRRPAVFYDMRQPIAPLGRRVLMAVTETGYRFFTDDNVSVDEAVELSATREISYITYSSPDRGYFRVSDEESRPTVAFTLTPLRKVEGRVNGATMIWDHYAISVQGMGTVHGPYPGNERPIMPRGMAEPAGYREPKPVYGQQPYSPTYGVNHNHPQSGHPVAMFEMDLDRHGDVFPGTVSDGLTRQFAIFETNGKWDLRGWVEDSPWPIKMPGVVKSQSTELGGGFHVLIQAGSDIGFKVRPRMDEGQGYYPTEFVYPDKASWKLDPGLVRKWVADIRSNQPGLYGQLTKTIVGGATTPDLDLGIVQAALATLVKES